MGDHGHVWTITPHLRWAWVTPEKFKGDEPPPKMKILQQAWENLNSDVEWREVPEINDA